MDGLQLHYYSTILTTVLLSLIPNSRRLCPNGLESNGWVAWKIWGGYCRVTSKSVRRIILWTAPLLHWIPETERKYHPWMRWLTAFELFSLLLNWVLALVFNLITSAIRPWRRTSHPSVSRLTTVMRFDSTVCIVLTTLNCCKDIV